MNRKRKWAGIFLGPCLGRHDPKACHGPKKRFTVPYQHGPMCLPCVDDRTQSSTKHERAVPCQPGWAQVPPGRPSGIHPIYSCILSFASSSDLDKLKRIW